MTLNRMKEFLAQSLDDVRLSRNERTVLSSLHEEWHPSPREQQLILHHACELVRDHLYDVRDKALVEWLEEVVKTIRPAHKEQHLESQACFFPEQGTENISKLKNIIKHCRKSIDICVFTITYNQLADELIAAHKRGVAVRIITDDEKSMDIGSDIERFEKCGMAVRTDNSSAHMHHKFALFDSQAILTGSFNWTRSAATANKEDFMVSNEPHLIASYRARFEALWQEFAPHK